MMRIARACGLALVAAACATRPPSPLPELTGVPQAFEMSGRLAIRQGDRSDIAKLRWSHAGPRDSWVISSPLGNELARIDSDEAGATLTQGSGQPQRAASFPELTERLVGVPLEPRLLAAWLHGDTSQAGPSGWSVSLDESRDAGSVRLARRLSATRGDVSVRLVVDDYRVGEAP